MADGFFGVSDLVVVAGGRKLLDGISLTVHTGRVVGVAGPSGAGKTLVCRSLLGLVNLVSSGEVRYSIGGRTTHLPLGGPDRTFREVRRTLVGWLPQEAHHALVPFRRVGRQVAKVDPARWLRAAGFPAEEVHRVAQSWPYTLSPGMGQRVVLAQILARGAPFVIADEPTNGLDPALQTQVFAQLRQLADEGRGVLVVAHDLERLREIADEVVIVEQGRVTEVLARGDPGAQTPTGQQLLADSLPWTPPPRAAPGESVWSVEDVHFSYRGWFRSHPVLRGASLSVDGGERVALVGPSGTGKSTLVQAGLGVVRPDRGRARATRPQWLPQDPRSLLNPTLPIGVQVEESAHRFRPHERAHDVAREALAQVGLLHRAEALPSELSGGERRRAAIARIAVTRPALLVADEVTTGLDASLRRSILALLDRVVGPAGALVLVSHDPLVMGGATHRRILVADGRTFSEDP